LRSRRKVEFPTPPASVTWLVTYSLSGTTSLDAKSRRASMSVQSLQAGRR